MKLTRHRMLLAGVIGIAAVGVPLSIPFVASEIGGAANAAPFVPDVLTYVQGSGTSGSSFSYTVGSDGIGTPTTQVITPSGRCGTPTVTGTPVLGLIGRLYPPDRDLSLPDTDDYAGTPSTVPVGSSKQHTGVCAVSAPWDIANDPGRGQEALDFTTVGANSAIGSTRVFSDAQIPLQLQEEASWNQSSTTVTLVEYLAGTVAGSQTCTITGEEGTTITADTAGNAVCTGSSPVRGFDTVEAQVPQDGSQVSVVGTSTLTLAPQVCGGQSITSTGPIAATLSIPSGGVCQSYTSFTSSSDSSGQNLTYDEFSPGTKVPFTFVIPWAPQPECQPGNDPTVNNTTSPLPECAPTQVTVDGTTYTDQTYCAAPSATQVLCTESKAFNYVLLPDGTTTDTQITETWGGLIDWAIRH